jgi:hypothetical protein
MVQIYDHQQHKQRFHVLNLQHHFFHNKEEEDNSIFALLFQECLINIAKSFFLFVFSGVIVISNHLKE